MYNILSVAAADNNWTGQVQSKNAYTNSIHVNRLKNIKLIGFNFTRLLQAVIIWPIIVGND